MTDDLKNICERAINEGQKLDLRGCCYGEPTGWIGPPSKTPNKYYYFLAGLVRSQHLCNILDIGTHFGGSIMSMAKGLHKECITRSRLVTVDIACKNEEKFKNYPYIKRVEGDATKQKVIKKITESFRGKIDLIYIDSDHKYEHVKTVIYVYANRLRPKYIVLDDILLNNSMKRLWKELKKKFKDRAYDVSKLGIRKDNVGFGVIDWNSEYIPNWMGTDIWVKCYPFGRRFFQLFIHL
jgi:cephalosporin hydroxylase